jgi:hypothetical protein
MKADRLFWAALAGLQAEDAALNQCFTKHTKYTKNAYRDVAHGLTYWLFETTLVYVIFKAWIPKVHVIWEHPLRQPKPRRTSRSGRGGAFRKCDLIVKEGGKTVMAFEAKWWNDNTARTFASLEADAKKLRTAFPARANVDRYILSFWSGWESDWVKDVDKANKLLARVNGLTLQRQDRFTTKHVDQNGKRMDPRPGYFALGLIKVE